MGSLLDSPLGSLLAKPWLDSVGFLGLRRWYLPLSRLWAAANAAGRDVSLFRDQVGVALPALWSDDRLQTLLERHARTASASETARSIWEAEIFAPLTASADPGELDHQRRAAATRHLATRRWFYPISFCRRAPLARWTIEPPDVVACDLGEHGQKPGSLYAAPIETGCISSSRPFADGKVREYWLRAPTPFQRLRRHPGSETLYARVIEPLGTGRHPTLIIGNGLCVETDLLPSGQDLARRLAETGWRVVEPVSPYHGLRAMPGRYGGEPFFSAGPTSSIDLIIGQAIETALLTAWSRERFGCGVAVAGISMTSFVAQQVASRCHLWPTDAQPNAVMLISHSNRIEDTLSKGKISAMLDLDRALADAGWSAEALSDIARMIAPADRPAIPPSNIISVLGEADRWLPYEDGLDLVKRWKLPQDNIFRYRVGHLGMPIQLAREMAPFHRLMRTLNDDSRINSS
jgi:hypothetical protein